MDEPLSNLDAKMRVQMRSEIIHLHRQLGVTTIYVTHDQTEAMTMGDRIVVMDGGLIQQIGTPEEIYNDPVNLYVAGFIGTPQANFIKGTISKYDDGFFFTNNNMSLKIPEYRLTKNLTRQVHGNIIGVVRPEYMSFTRGHAPKTAENEFRAIVDMVELVGADKYVHVNYGKEIATLRCPNSEKFELGEQLTIGINMDKFWFFNLNGGQRII
jgi:multiple sugar transport system ATP-binding protein